jgi:hypothetical protein
LWQPCRSIAKLEELPSAALWQTPYRHAAVKRKHKAGMAQVHRQGPGLGALTYVTKGEVAYQSSETLMINHNTCVGAAICL